MTRVSIFQNPFFEGLYYVANYTTETSNFLDALNQQIMPAEYSVVFEREYTDSSGDLLENLRQNFSTDIFGRYKNFFKVPLLTLIEQIENFYSSAVLPTSPDVEVSVSENVNPAPTINESRAPVVQSLELEQVNKDVSVEDIINNLKTPQPEQTISETQTPNPAPTNAAELNGLTMVDGNAAADQTEKQEVPQMPTIEDLQRQLTLLSGSSQTQSKPEVDLNSNIFDTLKIPIESFIAYKDNANEFAKVASANTVVYSGEYLSLKDFVNNMETKYQKPLSQSAGEVLEKVTYNGNQLSNLLP
ncbi:MAG: hypothetical protein LBM27_03935 [Lactobacillaceae bacterium]|jgi:hypothetical protein|nr:hypothetical protein [Lactobacillaceae bacterium]